MPGISAAWEAQAGKSQDLGQPRQLSKTLSLKKKKAGDVCSSV